jgi:hypothetical protein
MLADAVNLLYGHDLNYEFEWVSSRRGGTRTTALGLVDMHLKSMSEEAAKGAMIFKIGAIARVLGVRNGPLEIDGLDFRVCGRLTHWCQAHLGLTPTQLERDRTRPGRPRRLLPQAAQDVESPDVSDA